MGHRSIFECDCKACIATSMLLVLRKSIQHSIFQSRTDFTMLMVTLHGPLQQISNTPVSTSNTLHSRIPVHSFSGFSTHTSNDGLGFRFPIFALLQHGHVDSNVDTNWQKCSSRDHLFIASFQLHSYHDRKYCTPERRLSRVALC